MAEKKKTGSSGTKKLSGIKAGLSGKSGVSILAILAVVALAGFFIISTLKLRSEIKEKEEQLSRLNVSYIEQSEENSEMAEKISGEDESEFMERYAREHLDYIMPDERVYADSQHK